MQELGSRNIRLNFLDRGMVEREGLRTSGLHQAPIREQLDHCLDNAAAGGKPMRGSELHTWESVSKMGS